MTAETALGIFFILVLVLVFAGAVHEAWRRLGLLSRGVRTVAEVVGFEMQKDTDGTPRYFPVVAFTLPDGTKARAEASTGTPRETQGRVGDRVEIIYDRRRPKTIAVPSLDPGHTAFGTIATMVICAAGAAYGVVKLALEITR
ncbi:DUF3592 domain-containing protein [Streptomyces sp. NPDC002867]